MFKKIFGSKNKKHKKPHIECLIVLRSRAITKHNAKYVNESDIKTFGGSISAFDPIECFYGGLLPLFIGFLYTGALLFHTKPPVCTHTPPKRVHVQSEAWPTSKYHDTGLKHLQHTERHAHNQTKPFYVYANCETWSCLARTKAFDSKALSHRTECAQLTQTMKH